MVWFCRLIELAPDLRSLHHLHVGDMFFLPKTEHRSAWFKILQLYVNNLSDYYKENNSKRQPLFVMLPGKNLFCVDQKCITAGGWKGGWIVNGTAPELTVYPAIHLQGLYHGWIRNGIITPDLEGRLFNDDGKVVR